VLRIDVPPSIEWQCTSCGDEGVVSGWEHSPVDLRRRTTDSAHPNDDVEVLIDAPIAATLRSLMLIDSTSERLVFRARPSEHGIILGGNEDDLDELIGYVAAEANHEPDRRRQKRLDAAFDMLNDTLDRVECRPEQRARTTPDESEIPAQIGIDLRGGCECCRRSAAG
jgi:hypothetical protein